MVQGKSTKIGNKQIRTDKKDWIIVKNTHEAIISKETFEQVQEKLLHFKIENKKERKHIFKGKIFCGYCHYAMNKRVNKNPIFLCRHSEVDTSFPCYHLKMEEKEVEEIVF